MAGVVGGEEELEEFYVRYYVGHKGKFGHEFLEFEFRSNGMLRYANNSNYKNDTMIRKEVYVTPAVLKECRRIILESEVSLSSLLLTLFFRVLVFFVDFFGCGFLVWLLRKLEELVGVLFLVVEDLAVSVTCFIFRGFCFSLCYL